MYFYFSTNKNIILKGKVHFNKKPIINIKKNSKLIIGNNVKINSSNRKYHINMSSPVKLYADRDGATIEIGCNTRIHGSCIHAYDSIIIGKNCLIAGNCQIFDGNGHDLYLDDPSTRIKTCGSSKPITIGNDCWIGANSFILPGTQLGNNCVVSAGSVVRGKFSSNSLIGGNPAIKLKELM